MNQHPDSARIAPTATGGRTTFELFAAAAVRDPSAPAHVSRTGAVLTYQQLFRSAVALAELIKEPHCDRQP